MRLASTVFLIGAAAMLAGCAVGPDYRQPAAPAASSLVRGGPPAATAAAAVGAGEAQSFVVAQDIPAQWWTLFQSPQLNALIESSLKANPSASAAQAALRQAQELVY